jgi:hypothetical protein
MTLASKVKLVVIFGELEQVEYYTSRALDFQGCPMEKSTNITLLQLLSKWEWLKHAITTKALFKPLRLVRLYLPFQNPPRAFLDSLERVVWHVIEVEVPNVNQ